MVNKTCRVGSIVRKGYTRRLKNKSIRVPTGCIRSQSQSGKKRSLLDRAIMTKKRRMYQTYRKRFGTPRCKSKQIIREGYARKSYRRKSGIYVHSAKIRPGCIRAVGLSRKRGRKGTQLFVLKKGELTKYGYHANNSEMKRHQALHKALRDIKPLSVYRKLNALYVLNKNKDPTISKLYRRDAEWVQKTPEYVKHMAS